jgi:RNA polymerase sigma factor (TIGR02999 family)
MSRPDPHELTLALDSLRAGEQQQFELLLPLVYNELRVIASRQMSGEKVEHTLQPTALVHEAYLRLAGGAELGWANRAHFFAAAARAMRQVLVDFARRKGADKRGGGLQRVSLHEDLASELPSSDFDLLDLHESLEKLSGLDANLGRIVELRFFGGLTLDEVADVVGFSRRKVASEWAFARTWLARELTEEN